MIYFANKINSVRSDEILKSLDKDFDFLVGIWQNFEPTLTNWFCCWSNFHFCIWPKLTTLSGHTSSDGCFLL